jgi:hypothetical protein
MTSIIMDLEMAFEVAKCQFTRPQAVVRVLKGVEREERRQKAKAESRKRAGVSVLCKSRPNGGPRTMPLGHLSDVALPKQGYSTCSYLQSIVSARFKYVHVPRCFAPRCRCLLLASKPTLQSSYFNTFTASKASEAQLPD